MGSLAAPVGFQEVQNRVEIGALGAYFVGPGSLADFDDGFVQNPGFRCPEEVLLRRFGGQAVNLQLQLSQGAS